jgi:hypothetical protein
MENWITLHSLLDEIYLEEEKYWKLRSKDQWVKKGDLNTSYFHRVATQRKKEKFNTNYGNRWRAM